MWTWLGFPGDGSGFKRKKGFKGCSTCRRRQLVAVSILNRLLPNYSLPPRCIADDVYVCSIDDRARDVARPHACLPIAVAHRYAE